MGNLHDCINSTNWSRKQGSLTTRSKKSTNFNFHFTLFDPWLQRSLYCLVGKLELASHFMGDGLDLKYTTGYCLNSTQDCHLIMQYVGITVYHFVLALSPQSSPTLPNPPQVIDTTTIQHYGCTHTHILGSFPGLSHSCSSVCVQYNTQKQKSGEKQSRPGNTYHVMWT